MYTYRAALALGLAAVARSQLAGTLTTETHPSLSWSKCTGAGACSQQAGEIVIDANWRWTHNTQGQNCYTGNTWNAQFCPDDATCAANCAVDGADYEGTYGISTSGDSVSVAFVTHGQQTNIGSRFYLMASDTMYEEFDLLNNEFTFDVDVSNLPCGLNGAVYFVNMAADGGMSQYPGNKAGAKYGTGYCDSQCPRDLKFINGQGNVEGWQPSSNDPNSGVGGHGSCCAEMDIWEANSMSTALTPHACETVTQHMCDGDSCGGTYSSNRYGGDCDPDGCDFNPYRQGNESFYGMGKIVDTTKPFTITTQFLTGSDGTLNEIKRFYTQNGVKYDNPQSDISGVSGNSITESYCDAQKAAFGDTTSWQDKGGMGSMSSAMSKGMVLVMSLWDDHYSNMLWLDSTYPTNKTTAGGPRGACATDSGVPATIEQSEGNSKVIYSNIKFGPIGSTA